MEVMRVGHLGLRYVFVTVRIATRIPRRYYQEISKITVTNKVDLTLNKELKI